MQLIFILLYISIIIPIYMDFAKNTIVKCDIYGYPISFNMEANNESRSFVGGILSLIAITLIAFFFYLGIVDLLSGNNSKITVQEDLNFDPILEEISSNYFMFAIKIDPIQSTAAKQVFQSEEPIFSISLEQKIVQIVNDSRKKISEPLILEKCTKGHFQLIQSGEQLLVSDFINQRKTLDKLQIEKYMCPALNQTYRLAGIYASDLFSYVRIKITSCQDPQICPTNEGLLKLIEKYDINYFKVSMAFSNYKLNPKGQTQEIQPYINSDLYFSFLPGLIFPETDIYLEKTYFFEDTSVMPFQQSSIERYYYQIKNENFRTIQVFEKKNDKYADIDFRISSVSKTILRTNEKIDQFLAYIGGIVKFIYFFIGLFALQYNKFHFLTSLANKLYTFNMPKNDKSKFHVDELRSKIKSSVEHVKESVKQFRHGAMIAIKQLRVTKVLTNHHHHGQNTIGENLVNLSSIEPVHSQRPKFLTRKQFLNEMLKDVLKFQTEIRIVWKYFWGELFCIKRLYRNNEEANLFHKTVSMIYNDTDIVTLLNKIQEIDKLKKLLMNENQIRVFNFTPKPVVRIHDEQNEDKKKIIKKKKKNHIKSLIKCKSQFTTLKSLQKLYKAYEHLTKFDDKSNEKNNLKLMKLVGKDIEEIFQTAFQLEEEKRLKKEQEGQEIEEYDPDGVRASMDPQTINSNQLNGEKQFIAIEKPKVGHQLMVPKSSVTFELDKQTGTIKKQTSNESLNDDLNFDTCRITNENEGIQQLRQISINKKL